MAPQEILIALITLNPQAEGLTLKAVTGALTRCFEMLDPDQGLVFHPEALASTMQQLLVRHALNCHPNLVLLHSDALVAAACKLPLPIHPDNCVPHFCLFMWRTCKTLLTALQRVVLRLTWLASTILQLTEHQASVLNLAAPVKYA